MGSYARYPANWREISRAIREDRAHNCCENCGVRNHAWIVRSVVDGSKWVYFDMENACYVSPEGERLHPDMIDADILINTRTTRVVLTVHHIGVDYDDGTLGDPKDKKDCRPVNLIALCQRCHLEADREDNIVARGLTRRSKKKARARKIGQSELFGDDPQ